MHRASQSRRRRRFPFRYAAVVSWALAVASCACAPPVEMPHDDAASPMDTPPPDLGAHAALFVGNSYVYINDVAGHYRSALAPLTSELRVEEVTAGGYLWSQHATDAETDGTRLSELLREGPDEENAFDVVILQEQSQVGGFRDGTPDRESSVAAAVSLATLAQARGATTVLYLTWGRRTGDPDTEIFATYLAMQDRLDAGYLALAEHLMSRGIDARVAPVGGAFRLIYEDVIAGGGDPAAAGSDFDALYEPDGSHPSLRGAYLAACVIAASATATPPEVLGDEPTLGAAVSAQLRGVCRRAIDDPRWQIGPVAGVPPAFFAPELMGTGFGQAVSLSADGTRAFVGASSGDTAYAIERGTSWSHVGTLSVTAPVGIPANFGQAVTMSGDGAYAMVGAHSRFVDGVAAGAAYAYRRDGAAWVADGEVRGAVLEEREQFGGAAAIDGTGTRAVVGAASNGGGAGRALVFLRTDSGWIEEAVLAPSGAAELRAFGGAVAIDAAGERVVVGAGAALEGRPGAVRVFVRSGDSWTEEAAIPSPLTSEDWFGGAVAVTPDATLAVIGAQRAGQAFVYRRDGSTWSLLATLRARRALEGFNLGGRGPRFGSAVAISADGGRIAVGAPDEVRAAGRASGSVTIFDRSGDAYRETWLVLASDGNYMNRFGSSVALSADGRRLLIGSDGWSDWTDPDGVLLAGAVYEWVEETR